MKCEVRVSHEVKSLKTVVSLLSVILLDAVAFSSDHPRPQDIRWLSIMPH